MLKDLRFITASILAGDLRVARQILAWTVKPSYMSRADAALVRRDT